MSYVQRRQFLWILLLAGLVLFGLVANATTLTRLRLEDLAQESTAVARLRCLEAESYWEHGEIWTKIRFAVVETEKGVLPGIVSVRLMGGSVQHLHSRVDGVPRFRPGEEVYLFLWGQEGEPYRVLGWSQGTFRIVGHPDSGLETVTQDSAATPVFDPRTHTFHREGIRNLPVAAFREKLQEALRRQGK